MLPINLSSLYVYLQTGVGFARACANSNLNPKDVSEFLKGNPDALRLAKNHAATMAIAQAVKMQDIISTSKSDKKVVKNVLEERKSTHDLDKRKVIIELRLWGEYKPKTAVTDKKLYDCLVETGCDIDEAAVWLGMTINEVNEKINAMENPTIFRKSLNLQ